MTFRLPALAAALATLLLHTSVAATHIDLAGTADMPAVVESIDLSGIASFDLGAPLPDDAQWLIPLHSSEDAATAFAPGPTAAAPTVGLYAATIEADAAPEPGLLAILAIGLLAVTLRGRGRITQSAFQRQ